MGFWFRASIIPLVFGGLAFAGQGLSDQPAPVAPSDPIVVNVSFEDAQAVVDDKAQRLMGDKASKCWELPEDRRGRVPASAIVKRDGTTDVRLAQASEIASDEWVLAWCEKGV